MTKTVDFYFDFASPNAYLSHQVVSGIEERTGAKFNYIPVLLGGIFKATNNKPPMEAFFVTDFPQKFEELGSQFLGRTLTNIQHIKL